MPEPEQPPEATGSVSLAPAGTPPGGDGWVAVGYTTEGPDWLDTDWLRRAIDRMYGQYGPDVSRDPRLTPNHVHISFRPGGCIDGAVAAYQGRYRTRYEATSPRQPYAARATANDDQVAAHRPAPTGGVDDLTAAIEGLCTCPCRTPLDPAGPSAYFATQDCQRRWMRTTQADRPDDVEGRPDAMPGYTTTAYTYRAGDPIPLDQVTEADEVRAVREPELAYRRHCTACDVTAVPDTTDRVEHLTVDITNELAPGSVLPVDLTVGSRLATTQACANCGQVFDGPAYTPMIADAPGGWRLRLADGTFWTSYTLDRNTLYRLGQADRETVVNAAWKHMQDQLANRSMIPDPLRHWRPPVTSRTIFSENPAVGLALLAGMEVRDPRAAIIVTDV